MKIIIYNFIFYIDSIYIYFNKKFYFSCFITIYYNINIKLYKFFIYLDYIVIHIEQNIFFVESSNFDNLSIQKS